MKIFYAIQATGNGHISRAMQLLPYLNRYGKVDVFLSGANSQLPANLPVKYRSKGLSLFYNQGGGLNYRKIAQQTNIGRIIKEVKALPVENYDVVINDFECITALACRFKKVASVNFGHQASFQSPLVPRPAKKEWMGEFLLKNYAQASQYIGLHFKQYDDFIFEPVIKKEILEATPTNKGHITVYLSAYSDAVLLKQFSKLKSFKFQVFSKQVQQVTIQDNVTFLPVQQQLFNESMITAQAVITGAGFETPAEVLQLQKKLMVIPIKGQYEQYCNAAALETFGVPVLQKIDNDFPLRFMEWLASNQQQPVCFDNVAPRVVSHLLEQYDYKGMSLELLYPTLSFN
jgi:uncharacterized protein (TIGR00661 family)